MGALRDTISQHASDIRSLAQRRHARSIRLFGSVARGQDTPGSDVDFLVDFGPDASILDVVHLRLDLQRLLGTDVDVVPVGGLKSRDQHIVDEAVPV